MKIDVIHEHDTNTYDALVSGVREYNKQKLAGEVSKPLSVVLRDDNQAVIGGVAGRTIYQTFFIEVLWVDEIARGQGIGRRLMELAETEAINRGCVMAQVDTLAVQAPDFYQGLGFEVTGIASGITDKHDRYFFKKIYG
ncbi:GNAT family N-acetyltransferase [Parashewanella tropica]|uniref:GNAT family N-acetyltransferase n=1 Tax=Parashewanella tropica TaxID=2547970 RepID=UPI00105A4D69|nr:GNAT family N-acetyltransferase [Parashewanella tropica]